MNIGDTALGRDGWQICRQHINGQPVFWPIEGAYRVRNMRLLDAGDTVFIKNKLRLEQCKFLCPAVRCKDYGELLNKGINEQCYMFAKVLTDQQVKVVASKDVYAFICAKKRFGDDGKKECMRMCMATCKNSCCENNSHEACN